MGSAIVKGADMPKVILFNGAKNSGKTIAARDIADQFYGYIISASDRLKIGTHWSLNTDQKVANAYESVKDIPCEEFFGLTPRQAYINHSEKYLKPLYGTRIIGDFFCKDCIAYVREENWDTAVFINESLGFVDELYPIIELFGPDNVCIINIHRGHVYKNGEIFAGDSRYMITQTPDNLPDVTTFTIYNNDTESEFILRVYEVAKKFLGA